MAFLKSLFIRVVQIHKGFDVIAMREAEFLFAQFETLLRRRILGRGAIEHHLRVRALFGGGFFYVVSHPIVNLSVDKRILHRFNHLLMRDAGGLEPHGIKALPKISVIIGMQFAGEMQTDLVHVTRQMHPTVHDFARTARINDFAHARIIGCPDRSVNWQGFISELTSAHWWVD